MSQRQVVFGCVWLLWWSSLQLAAAVNTAGEEDNNDDGGTMESTVVLLFMFFGLGLGIVLMQLLSKIGEAIPYTCAVFVLGLLFAGLASSTDTLGRSINNWFSAICHHGRTWCSHWSSTNGSLD